MADRVRLNPGGVEVAAFLAWVEAQIERDRMEWEKACERKAHSQFLRGRISAWRLIQSLARPQRGATVDGKLV